MMGAITGVLFFALAAVAIALENNTVDYTSTIDKGKKTPLGTNIAYNGVLKVSTSDDKQPNSAPLTEVFFAKELKNNAARLPSCKQSDVDGKDTVPAKCKRAIVGSGTASSLVGAPGNSSPPSLRQDLEVTAINGDKGKQIMLLLNGGPVHNRVIPGPIQKVSGGDYAYKVNFTVPRELQGQAGAQIALTDFDVDVTTKLTAKVPYGKKPKKKGKKRKTTRVSYLQLKRCPASGTIPSKAIVHFNDDEGNASSRTIESEKTMSCK
jgi:hypothetical protein